MRYRLRDLWILPAWLSWSRVILAACFPWCADTPPLALLVLTVAGLSDVLDGFVARRYGLVTATGAVLDPLTDKLFVLTVAITLIVTGHLSLTSVLLLSTREIAEFPLVAWLALSPRARAARTEQPLANAPGKLATALQFASVAWALFRQPGLGVWIAVTALAGAFAGLRYWQRALRGARPPHAPGELGS